MRIKQVAPVGVSENKEGVKSGGRDEHSTYDQGEGGPILVTFKMGGPAQEIAANVARRLLKDFPGCFAEVTEEEKPKK